MQKNCIIFLNIYAGVPWLLLLLTPTEQNHSRRKKKTVAEFMHHELVVTGIYSQNYSVLVGLMQWKYNGTDFPEFFLWQESRLSYFVPFNARQSRLHLSSSAERELDTTAHALAKSMQPSRFPSPPHLFNYTPPRLLYFLYEKKKCKQITRKSTKKSTKKCRFLAT